MSPFGATRPRHTAEGTKRSNVVVPRRGGRHHNAEGSLIFFPGPGSGCVRRSALHSNRPLARLRYQQQFSWRQRAGPFFTLGPKWRSKRKPFCLHQRNMDVHRFSTGESFWPRCFVESRRGQRLYPDQRSLRRRPFYWKLLPGCVWFWEPKREPLAKPTKHATFTLVSPDARRHSNLVRKPTRCFP